jgi:hypothetical protein
MADHEGDPSKQPPGCKSVFTPIQNHPQGLGHWSKCPNLKETGGGMDGERWSCGVCGKSYWLDYDEMR